MKSALVLSITIIGTILITVFLIYDVNRYPDTEDGLLFFVPIVATIALFSIYLLLVLSNKKITKNQKLKWITFILLCNVIGMFSYFFQKRSDIKLTIEEFNNKYKIP